MKRMVVECHGCCWVVAEALQLFQAEFQQANVRTLRVGGEMILHQLVACLSAMLFDNC